MKRIRTALCLILAAALLAGCAFLPSDSEPETPAPTDPLTGLVLEWQGQRPVAVAIENSTASTTQWGLSSASVVLEALTEVGTSTELCLVYPALAATPKVGPVAAGQDIYWRLLVGQQPIPVQRGGGQFDQNFLDYYSIRAVDALEAGRTAFDCGSEWSNAPLWYTSGEAISNVLDELSISSVLTESRVTSAASAAADSASSGADAVLSIPALLPQEADGKLPDATAPDAVNVRVCFDDNNATGFAYDPDSGPAEMRLFAALPEGAAGKTLVLRCAEPSALSAMLSSESVLATQTKLSSYYFRRSLYALVFFLLCVLCAVELGVLMVTMRSIFTPEVQHQTRVMIGLMLDVGIWVLTDSELLTLFTDKASFVAFLSLLSFGLIVPLTLEFIRCTLKEECRGLRLLQQVQMLLLTADILGWLLRGWAMFWLLPLMHLTILASIPLTLRDLFAAYKKTRSEDVRDILVGFGALAVCAAAALVFFYGDHAGWQYAVFYCVGLLCFLLQLGRTVIHRVRQAIDEQAQLENYKNLAYVDSLTGLFNYTAFKYMKSRWPERTDWTYIVMDVNWLKQTNDQYGHRAGDELLCCAARCIREAFYRAEDCFRIGGDEFAVIATAADEDAVKAAVEKLRNLCAEWDAKEEYPVSIAVGYAMQAGRTMTADELFMEADAAMYRNKAEIKKAVGGIIR